MPADADGLRAPRSPRRTVAGQTRRSARVGHPRRAQQPLPPGLEIDRQDVACLPGRRAAPATSPRDSRALPSIADRGATGSAVGRATSPASLIHAARAASDDHRTRPPRRRRDAQRRRCRDGATCARRKRLSEAPDTGISACRLLRASASSRRPGTAADRTGAQRDHGIARPGERATSAGTSSSSRATTCTGRRVPPPDRRRPAPRT